MVSKARQYSVMQAAREAGELSSQGSGWDGGPRTETGVRVLEEGFVKAKHVKAQARSARPHPVRALAEGTGAPSSRRAHLALAPLALAIAALRAVAASSALAAVDVNQASAAKCPNEVLRAENGSLALPDCRALSSETD